MGQTKNLTKRDIAIAAYTAKRVVARRIYDAKFALVRAGYEANVAVISREYQASISSFNADRNMKSLALDNSYIVQCDKLEDDYCAELIDMIDDGRQ